MHGTFADDDDLDEGRVDSATDRQLRDTFGVTDEGMRALTERARADKARDAAHPRPLLKGRAGDRQRHDE